MNTDNLLQFIQQGFHIAIGSATTLADTVQNPQTAQDKWQRLVQNPNQFAQELAEKGSVTEQEARQLVDRMINPQPSEVTITTTATAVTPDVQAELQDLMAQLASLRSEIAQLRQQREG